MNENYIPGGFILLSRKLLESEIMQKPPLYLSVWIYLLMNANHKDRGGIKRGQGFVSISELQEAVTYYVGYRKVQPSKSQIWGVLEYLRNSHEGTTNDTTKDTTNDTMNDTMIRTEKTTRGLLYTIVKYNIYQDGSLYENNNERNAEQNAEQDNEKITKKLRTPQPPDTIHKNERIKESYYYYKGKKSDKKSESSSSLFAKNLFAMLSGYGMNEEEFANAGYEKIDNLKDYQKALFAYKEKNGVD